MLLLGLFSKVVIAGELDDWDDDFEEIEQGKVFMTGEFLNGDLLKVSVDVEEMLTPILGMAFHLNYEGDRLAFLKYEPGNFLEKGGDPFYLVKNVENKSEIVFGETLRRNDAFPLGKGRIVDFYFEIIGEREFQFKFDRGVVSTLNVVRQDIDRVIWEDLDLKEGLKKANIASSTTQVYSPVFTTSLSSSKGLISLIVGLVLMACVGFYFLFKNPRGKSVNFK